jgi:hypothetical protein
MTDAAIAPRTRPISIHLLVFLGAVVLGALVVSAAFWWGGLLGSFALMAAAPVLFLWGALLFLRALSRLGGAYAVLQLGLVGLSPILFFVVLQLSSFLLAWGTLAADYRHYVHVITLAEQQRLPPPGGKAFQAADDGTLFEAERQAPHRIAFPMPGGFLNNWQGILYDPAGIGLRAGGSAKNLLAGISTVKHCRRMTWRFFYCSFS